MTYLPHHVVLKNGREDVVCACGEHFVRRVLNPSVSYEPTSAITQWVAHYKAEQAADETRGGDGPCRDCGKRYPAWFAPHEVWNAIVSEDGTATDDPGGLLCPTCFVVLAESRGSSVLWSITPAPRRHEPRVIL